MKFCTCCGVSNEDGNRFCQKCGTQFPKAAAQESVPALPTVPQEAKKRCPCCGERYEMGSPFCSCCGSTLSSATPEMIPSAESTKEVCQYHRTMPTQVPLFSGSMEKSDKTFVQKLKGWWKRVNKKKFFLISSGSVLTIAILVLVIIQWAFCSAMSGTCGAYGDNLRWECDWDGTLTIYGEGKMEDYRPSITYIGETRDRAPWNELWWVDIDTIVIEEGVTSIGSGMGIGVDLISIDIPDSVTSIGECAFQNEFSLKSIDIPDSVTEIGACAFEYCKQLKTVRLPENLEEIGFGAFRGCTSLNYIEIPSEMTTIGENAFSGCTGLTSVVIPEGVSSIGARAFSGCTRLKEIKLPKSLREIHESAFAGTGLVEIEIPGGTGVIGKFAFSNCTSLKKITFLGVAPNWKSSEDEKMSWCFYGVTATVYYPRWNESWDNYYGIYLGDDLTFVPY